MGFLSWMSDLSDLSPCAAFWESSLTCSPCVCPVLPISTLEKKPLILKEHSLLLPRCPFVCSPVSPSSVQGVSQLSPGRALQKGVAFLCPQSCHKAEPSTPQLGFVHTLKPTSVSNSISAAVSSLPVGFQSEGRFYQSSLLATGSISSAASVRGSECSVLGQHFGNDAVTDTCAVFCPTHMSRDSLFASLIVAGW